MNQLMRKQEEMKADCSQCCGLCCAALYFAKMDGFPYDKQAMEACHYLLEDYRCQIHPQLVEKGLSGCIGYDCFGAGQFITQIRYKKETWKQNKEIEKEMFEVFPIVFQLFQIRYYILEAKRIAKDATSISKLQYLYNENELIANAPTSELLQFSLDEYRASVNKIIKDVLRNLHLKRVNHCLGKNFAKQNLDSNDFTMTLLIATNFEGCQFGKSVFLGADTRDANFKNADLSQALFLSQEQVNRAKGNCDTKLPKHLSYPITYK